MIALTILAVFIGVVIGFVGGYVCVSHAMTLWITKKGYIIMNGEIVPLTERLAKNLSLYLSVMQKEPVDSAWAKYIEENKND